MSGANGAEHQVIVLTPFAQSTQLAAACVLSDIHGHVVPIGAYHAVAVDDPDFERAREQAATLSKIAGRMDVLLLIRREGQIDASQWRRGAHEADVPAGLALSKLPSVLEQLLLGSTTPEQVEGSISTRGMTKLQASAAAMTPERHAIARTALMWSAAAILALVVLIFALIIALGGTTPAWAGVAAATLVLGFAVWRVVSLLGLGRKGVRP